MRFHALFELALCLATFTVAMSQPEYVWPSDPEFSVAKLNHNQMRTTQPAVIAFCRTENDVIAALKYARQLGVSVTVRSGRHCYESLSIEDNTLVIDVGQM